MTFDEWLSEIENFSSRSERLYEDFLEVKDLAKLRMWLEAAYEVGRQEGYEKAVTAYQRERDRYVHNNPEYTGAYFLAGGHGEVDSNYLPEFVRIVPAYGCAWEQVYVKTDKTISYEGG